MPPAHPLRFPYRNELLMPVVGMEAEFKVFVDGDEVVPETYWRTPAAFVARPLLQRSSKASQLPTGGAVYFDGGVIEVVTPVIELGPRCAPRVVRSVWEQIGFVRRQLDHWTRRTGSDVRLHAFSCHYNVSYEIPREERNRDRTIQKLALLLAHLLSLPVIVAAANPRSTGVGVRPRRDRIEITVDFTPDPALMAATAALVIGIVRDVMQWSSYRLDDLDARPLPRVSAIDPARHATRNGWIVRAANFPHDPFRTDPDAPVWQVDDGRRISMRQIALETATFFRDSIRHHADPFSEQVLFSILEGSTPSLLDLPERPAAYDDIGREVSWGTTLPELYPGRGSEGDPPLAHRRRADRDAALQAPWLGDSERRKRVTMPARVERRSSPDRRATQPAERPPRLERSEYEKVFRRLGSGKRLEIDGEVLTPVAVRGWYHAVFRTPEGEERLLTIDQVLEHIDRWRE